jgi:hypothetical protein
MRENHTSGTVQGVPGNRHSYCDNRSHECSSVRHPHNGLSAERTCERLSAMYAPRRRDGSGLRCCSIIARPGHERHPAHPVSLELAPSLVKDHL